MSKAASTVVNPNSAATVYDGTTAMLAMTTAGATTADIGDHIELRLKNTGANTALTSYA